MRVKTVLNRCLRFKGFVYGKAEFCGETIMVSVEARKGSRPICSECGTAGSVYDHEATHRAFEHIPLWGFAVFLIYRMRRVACKVADGWWWNGFRGPAASTM